MFSTVLALLGLGVGYVIGVTYYNLYFHPLSKYPGPLLWRASRIPISIRHSKGELAFDLLALHQKYGNIVRVAPDELVFAKRQAFKDIYTPQAGKFELDKTNFYKPDPTEPENFGSATSATEHRVYRRALAPSFSDRAVREQESILRHYIDLLMRRLRENAGARSEPVDLCAWFHYTTFDIIGDLTFGESFECLQRSAYHPWIIAIRRLMPMLNLIQSLNHYSFMSKTLRSFAPVKILKYYYVSLEQAREKLSRRMDLGNRPDLINNLLRENIKLDLSMDELISNANGLVIAGSKTVATLLTCVIYLLLTNSSSYEKLKTEVRSAFATEDDISIVSVRQLIYMIACLNEALRLHNPVPGGLPRVVPDSGAVICGEMIPAGTVVSVYQHAICHLPENFKTASAFHPERFLKDPDYATDKLENLELFSVGPRDCLGQNLAHAEMRLILARLIFNFDIRLSEESMGLLDKPKAFLVYELGPLKVSLTPVERQG